MVRTNSIIFRKIWSIKNIGDQFITIETQNTAGLDISDTVKVVTKLDIYKPDDFSHTGLDGPLYPVPDIAVPFNDNDIKIPQTNSSPAINIKIVNGNEGSSITGQENADSSVTDVMQDSGNKSTPITPSLSESSGNIDFGKELVIKKV